MHRKVRQPFRDFRFILEINLGVSASTLERLKWWNRKEQKNYVWGKSYRYFVVNELQLAGE